MPPIDPRQDNTAIMTAIQALTAQVQSLVAQMQLYGNQIASVDTKVANLSDVYAPRRETDGRFSNLKDHISALEAQVATINERQVAEIQRVAQETIAIQKQLNQESKEAQSGISGVRIAGMNAVNAVIMLLLGAMATALLSILIHR